MVTAVNFHEEVVVYERGDIILLEASINFVGSLITYILITCIVMIIFLLQLGQ